MSNWRGLRELVIPHVLATHAAVEAFHVMPSVDREHEVRRGGRGGSPGGSAACRRELEERPAAFRRPEEARRESFSDQHTLKYIRRCLKRTKYSCTTIFDSQICPANMLKLLYLLPANLNSSCKRERSP